MSLVPENGQHRVRFGDPAFSPTVWNVESYEVEDLLLTLLEVEGGPAALERAMAAIKERDQA